MLSNNAYPNARGRHDFVYHFRGLDKVAFFEAYIDLGGTHDDSKAVSVGGIIAEQSSWDAIMDSWLGAHECEGAQQFHANMLQNKKGEYKDWSDEKRDRFVGKLLASITDNSASVFGLGIVRSDFEHIREQIRGCKIGINGFALMAGIGMLVLACDSLDMDNDRVGIVVESGERGDGKVRDYLGSELRLPDLQQYYRLSAITCASKSVFRQLELADLVAYETYKWCKNEIEGRSYIRYPMRVLRESCDSFFSYSSERFIRLWLERFMSQFPHRRFS
jgi:hypothetical protein